MVRRAPDGVINDFVPAGFNVRTRVHEYGGGAFAVRDGAVCFSNFSISVFTRSAPATPRPGRSPLKAHGSTTPDGVFDWQQRRPICVREDHTGTGREPVNSLVAIALDGVPVGRPGGEPGSKTLSPGDVLASGHDFYSTPRLSPDGSRLAWLCWNHPQMPWDGGEWVATVGADGSLHAPLVSRGGWRDGSYSRMVA